MAKKKLFAEEPQLSIYNNLKPAQFKKLKDYPYKRMFYVGQVEKMYNKELQRQILSSEIAGAFNWYNVNTNNKQQKQFVINYLKEQKEPKELINIVRINRIFQNFTRTRKERKTEDKHSSSNSSQNRKINRYIF